jgi:hypothetical protein
MDTPHNFDAVMRAVSSVIDAWDLYGFLKNGAPSNEYDIESGAIARRIDEIRSVSDAARVVSAVFSEKLGLDLPPEDSAQIGEQLYAKLREADLLETPSTL